MRSRAFIAAVGLGALLLAACRDPAPTTSRAPTEPTPAVLPKAPGVVARVGTTTLLSGSVARVSEGRQLSAAEAVKILVDEQLLSEAALAAGAGRDPTVRGNVDSILARHLVRGLTEAARAQGAYDEREFAEALDLHWAELDRPETRQVVHALVKSSVQGGAAVAEALRSWIAGKYQGQDAQARESSFREAVASFAGAPEPPTIETLGPFARDGRMTSGGALEPSFAEAAFVVAPGEISALVKTSYGHHVVAVLAVLPPHRATDEEQRRTLAPELLARRVRPQWQALIERLHAARPSRILATDADLMAVGKPPRREPTGATP